MYDRNMEKWEPSYLASGLVEWWTQFEKPVILKILSINLHTRNEPQKDMYDNVYCNIICNSRKLEAA